MNLKELKKEFDSTIPQLLNDGIINIGIGIGYDNDEFIVGGNIIKKLWQWFSSKIEPTLLALSKLQLQHLEATEQIEQLKAENEKLEIQLTNATHTCRVLENRLAEARQSERARIVGILRMEYLAYENDEVISNKEFKPIDSYYDVVTKAITADQPTQKSCEGCEHLYSPTSSLLETCGKCINKSNYQGETMSILDEIKKMSIWAKAESRKPFYEEEPSEVMVRLSDIEKILGGYEKKQMKIFRWLLGYEHFPPRKDGEGAYWWRSNLRVLLNQIGITKEKLEQFER